MSDQFDVGFRIVGPINGDRRRVSIQAAFQAYAECDAKAEVGKEAYLSLFAFDSDFTSYLRRTRSTKGFDGPCWARFIWWDVDRSPEQGAIAKALADTRRLGTMITEVFGISEMDLLVFFSGSKGFHIGVPTAGFNPPPAVDFHRVVRQFAQMVAAQADVVIDTSVYDKVRALRAPNSRHPKTGLHKRFLTVKELLHLSVDQILGMAREPMPFDVPEISPSASCNGKLRAFWDQARQAWEATSALLQQRVAGGEGGASLSHHGRGYPE